MMFFRLNPGLTWALATLYRGTAFLGNGLSAAAKATPSPIVGPCRQKVIGNGLRELDRFLSVLIDEVASQLPSQLIDAAHLARQRNTANKLRSLYAAMGQQSPDHARLRALGRCRDCLYYCNGVATRSDTRHGATMTLGWPNSTTADAGWVTIPMGEGLAIGPADLAWICRFYDRLAADLLASARPQQG